MQGKALFDVKKRPPQIEKGVSLIKDHCVLLSKNMSVKSHVIVSFCLKTGYCMTGYYVTLSLTQPIRYSV